MAEEEAEDAQMQDMMVLDIDAGEWSVGELEVQLFNRNRSDAMENELMEIELAEMMNNNF